MTAGALSWSARLIGGPLDDELVALHRGSSPTTLVLPAPADPRVELVYDRVDRWHDEGGEVRVFYRYAAQRPAEQESRWPLVLAAAASVGALVAFAHWLGAIG